MGVDLGTRRIGVALCDRQRTMAFPWGAVERSGDESAALVRLVALAVEEEVTTVVVGLPLSLDGSHGPAAQRASAEREQLAAALAPHAVAVVPFDERFTTVSAAEALGRAGVRGAARRKVVDAAAATVLLQAWIDTGPNRPG